MIKLVIDGLNIEAAFMEYLASKNIDAKAFKNNNPEAYHKQLLDFSLRYV